MSVDILRLPRQAGKTIRCIGWMLADRENRIIVCANQSRAQELRRRLADLTKTSPSDWTENVMSFDTRTSQLAGRRNKTVWIDQADHLLQQLMYGARLEGVTWDA